MVEKLIAFKIAGDDPLCFGAYKGDLGIVKSCWTKGPNREVQVKLFPYI
jgi:hypothetical protein